LLADGGALLGPAGLRDDVQLLLLHTGNRVTCVLRLCL
jgi:hypothetical protein